MHHTAEARRAEELAYQLAKIFDFRLGDEPEEIFLQTLRYDFDRQIAPLHGADDRADIIDRVRITAQQRGHADIAPDLHDVGDDSFLAKKTTLLGDIKINRGDAAAGIGDDDFFDRRLSAAVGGYRQRQENGQQQRLNFHWTLQRSRFRCT